MIKKKILFLCTGNACRSQIAEAYAKQFLSNEAEIYSAGIKKIEIDPRAIQMLKDDGIDTSNLKSQTLDEFKDIYFDLVITLCSDVDANRPPDLKRKKVIFNGFMDLKKVTGNEEEIINTFNIVRKQIKGYVKNVLPQELL